MFRRRKYVAQCHEARLAKYGRSPLKSKTTLDSHLVSRLRKGKRRFLINLELRYYPIAKFLRKIRGSFLKLHFIASISALHGTIQTTTLIVIQKRTCLRDTWGL